MAAGTPESGWRAVAGRGRRAEEERYRECRGQQAGAASGGRRWGGAGVRGEQPG